MINIKKLIYILLLLIILSGCKNNYKSASNYDPIIQSDSYNYSKMPAFNSEHNVKDIEILSDSSDNVTYIANISTKKFHRTDCQFVKQMLEKNKKKLYCTLDEARKKYNPCKMCKP